MSMSRTEIRRRALRAAAAVTLSMGFMGCAANVVDGESDDDEQASAEETPTPTAPAPAATEASASTPAPTVTVGPKAFVNCNLATDYLACCDAHNWAPVAGCLAWGPPMPPAMGVA
jgi:hypothetical protein